MPKMIAMITRASSIVVHPVVLTGAPGASTGTRWTVVVVGEGTVDVVVVVDWDGVVVVETTEVVEVVVELVEEVVVDDGLHQ
jgi:hypothetical protein